MTKKKRKFFTKPSLTYDEFLKKLEIYKETLDSSVFYNELRNDLKKCCDNAGITKIEEIICYGLGHFAECLIAKYQLALLLSFKSCFAAEVHIYDPIFSDVEVEFLKNLQLSVIDHNEEGARNIDSFSLIYMPHCPTPLVNNLLWHNWSPKISKFILIGNSFNSLVASQPERNFKERFSYIHSILPFTEEVPISNIFKYTDIFNDMSIHYFSTTLNELPKEFWENQRKPEYDETDMECISNKMKNISMSNETH